MSSANKLVVVAPRLHLAKVYQAYRYKAARWAIRSLAPKWRKGGLAMIERQQNTCRWHWIRAAAAAVSAGWNMQVDRKAEFDPRRFNMICFCPPVGVEVKGEQPKSKFCTFRLCPFCYARQYVLWPFMKLEKFLWGSLENQQLLRPCWLVEFHRRCEWQHEKPEGKDIRSLGIESLIAYEEHSHLYSFRRAEIDAIAKQNFLAGLVHIRIHYRRLGPLYAMRSGLIVTTRGADLSQHKANLKPEKGALLAFNVYENVTRESLARALSHVSRYPAGWLKAAPPEQLWDYLTELNNANMFSTYGGMRGIDLTSDKTSFEEPA